MIHRYYFLSCKLYTPIPPVWNWMYIIFLDSMTVKCHANILTRLVASFPRLFTTSGNVFCLKFCGVWEMFWIFKAARWTHDRCTKINKSPTVSNGVGASSFEIWTANLAQLLTVGTLTNSQSFIFGDANWKFCSQLPHRHPKTWHPDAHISDLDFFLCFYFWVKKFKTCWIYIFAN